MSDWKPWGDHPVVVALTCIAAVATIVAAGTQLFGANNQTSRDPYAPLTTAVGDTWGGPPPDYVASDSRVGMTRLDANVNVRTAAGTQASTSPTAPPLPVVESAPVVLHSAGFDISLESCVRQKLYVTCTLTFVNRGVMRQLGVWPTGKDPDDLSSIRDLLGKRYGPPEIAISADGATFWPSNEGVILSFSRKGASRIVRLRFGGVPAGVNSLEQLHLICAVYANGGSSEGQPHIDVAFTKIQIVGA